MLVRFGSVTSLCMRPKARFPCSASAQGRHRTQRTQWTQKSTQKAQQRVVASIPIPGGRSLRTVKI